MELVPGTRRLALMNCLLHGMEGDDKAWCTWATPGQRRQRPAEKRHHAEQPALRHRQRRRRPDPRRLDACTSNKQLAFLQHIVRHLKDGGRAAVVLPDNVLFEAGVGADIRRDLMDKCRLHTILRLPTGIFYAQGVKTNVLFFQSQPAATGSTQEVWVYDMRANAPKFGKRTPLTRAHFADFVACLRLRPQRQGRAPRPGRTGRYRRFSREWIQRTERGDSLDIAWLKDDNAEDAAICRNRPCWRGRRWRS
jgi:type I restriction enzyme M protein